jgi:regulator of RNase E activity RraA
MYICVTDQKENNIFNISALTKENRQKLKRISTATIATCLYKKGYRNQYIQNVFPLKRLNKSKVEEAFTLRYIPAREDLNPVSAFRNPEHPQRVAVEQCPEGAILVIDSRNNARAASAGSILVTRLMKRGVSGIVTDGGFRDSSEIADLDFPSFHQKPSAPTNLTLHQALDINVPIGCGDVAVFPGDIIVGDNDGVMVIPSEIINEVTQECIEMTLFEDFVLEQVNKGATIIGLYPPTKEETLQKFEKWKLNNVK